MVHYIELREATIVNKEKEDTHDVLNIPINKSSITGNIGNLGLLVPQYTIVIAITTKIIYLGMPKKFMHLIYCCQQVDASMAKIIDKPQISNTKCS